MVQKVLLGQAKVAMLCAPWAHVQKSSFVFFSPKVCEGETCFLQKSWIFQVKTAPRLFPPSPACVEEGGFFSSALEFTEGTCCSGGKLGFPAALSWQKWQ